MDIISNYLSLSSKKEKETYYNGLSSDERLNVFLNVGNNDKNDILSFASIDDLKSIFEYFNLHRYFTSAYNLIKPLDKNRIIALYEILDDYGKEKLSNYINNMQLNTEVNNNNLLNENYDLSTKISDKTATVAKSNDKLMSNKKELENVINDNKITIEKLEKQRKKNAIKMKRLAVDQKKRYEKMLKAFLKFQKKSVFKFVNNKRLEKYKYWNIMYNGSLARMSGLARSQRNIVSSIEESNYNTNKRANDLNKEIIDLEKTIEESNSSILDSTKKLNEVSYLLKNNDLLIRKLSETEKSIFGKSDYFKRAGKRFAIIEENKEEERKKKQAKLDALAEEKEKQNRENEKKAQLVADKKHETAPINNELGNLYDFISSLNDNGIQIPNLNIVTNRDQFIEKFEIVEGKEIDAKKTAALVAIRNFKKVKDEYDRKKENQRVVRFETVRKNKENKLVGRFGKLFEMLHSLNELGIVQNDAFLDQNQFLDNFEKMRKSSKERQVNAQNVIDYVDLLKEAQEEVVAKQNGKSSSRGYVNYFYFMLVASVLLILIMIASVFMK